MQFIFSKWCQIVADALREVGHRLLFIALKASRTPADVTVGRGLILMHSHAGLIIRH